MAEPPAIRLTKSFAPAGMLKKQKSNMNLLGRRSTSMPTQDRRGSEKKTKGKGRRQVDRTERLIDLMTESGSGALHIACRLSSGKLALRLVNRLIEAGAKVSEKSRMSSLTPLMFACRCGALEVVKTLLFSKADPMTEIGDEVPEAPSRTALEATCVYRRVDCLSELVRYVKENSTAEELSKFINQQSLKGRLLLCARQ